MIADVVGHGLAASLLATNLHAAAHVALLGAASLPEVAQRVNRLICRNTEPHVFITAILGMADVETGCVRFVSAGHHGPILVRGGAVEVTRCEGSLPLGISADETFEERAVECDGSCVALFYTDGLIEASANDSPLLGLDAVREALASIGVVKGAEVIRSLRGVVRRHLKGEANEDDMTLLTLQWSG